MEFPCRMVAEKIIQKNKNRVENFTGIPKIEMIGKYVSGTKRVNRDFNYFMLSMSDAANASGLELCSSFDATYGGVTYLVEKANDDTRTSGIIVENGLDYNIYDRIVFNKDIDCCNSINLGMFYGNRKNPYLYPTYIPATAEAVIELLEFRGFDLDNSKIAVIGRGTVGRSVATLCTQKNAMVTICHSKTSEDHIKEICRNSNIIVACTGHPLYHLDEWIGDRTIAIVNVGLTDVPKEVFEKYKDSSMLTISPAKNGIGLITSALLCKHAIDSYEFICLRSSLLQKMVSD